MPKATLKTVNASSGKIILVFINHSGLAPVTKLAANDMVDPKHPSGPLPWGVHPSCFLSQMCLPGGCKAGQADTMI